MFGVRSLRKFDTKAIVRPNASPGQGNPIVFPKPSYVFSTYLLDHKLTGRVSWIQLMSAFFPLDPGTLEITHQDAKQIGASVAGRYQSTTPYHYICIDDFLPLEI